MRVFVTGATGVLGRPTVRELIARGHRVRALARSQQNETQLKAAGAEPARGDLFDAGFLAKAVIGCEAVLHLATKIPMFRDASKKRAWEENDKIRTVGTRLLADAAIAAKANCMIYPGITFFYPDRGAEWIENCEAVDVPEMLRSSIDAENEIARFTRAGDSVAGNRGIVLRMGGFYAPGAPNAVDTLAAARRGVALNAGKSNAYMPMIWVDDAARAVATALEKAPAGIYDIVEDEPLTRGEMREALAAAAGRKRIVALPVFLVRLSLGKGALFLTRSQRVSNRRFKEATGWAPEVKNSREGWRRIGEAARRD